MSAPVFLALIGDLFLVLHTNALTCTPELNYLSDTLHRLHFLPPSGGAAHYSDRLDFLKILFHIKPERLERDRCCQTMMDEPLLKGHQGNNRQPSEPWKQRAKLVQSLLPPRPPHASPQLSDWKMSAIRKYANVKVVSHLMCRVLK